MATFLSFLSEEGILQLTNIYKKVDEVKYDYLTKELSFLEKEEVRLSNLINANAGHIVMKQN